MKLSKILELPEDAFNNTSRVEIIGSGEVIIEGHRGILDYQNHSIKINTDTKPVTVKGSNLYLKGMSSDYLIITGEIHGISYVE